jgi:hypothetical protein
MRTGNPLPGGGTTPTESGKGIFAFLVTGIVFAIYVHFTGLQDAAADLLVCRPGIEVLDGRLNLMSAFYWAVEAGFWVYFVLWAVWMVTRWPPWKTRNPTSFSREVLSGKKAWDEAQNHLMAVLTDPYAPPVRRLRYLAHLVFGVWTVGGGMLLLFLIASCGNCPTHPLGNCSAVAGGPAGGALVAVIYYDLRIKFSPGFKTAKAQSNDARPP